MRRLRSPGIARLVIALITGLALLLPEVSHSLAHHHAAEHRSMHSGVGHYGEAGADAGDFAATSKQGHAEHPHFDVVATQPTKPLLAQAVVVRVAALLLNDLREERPLPPVRANDLLPGEYTHGPPPPSRAPPQV